MLRSERNNEEMKNIHYKVQRDYEKLNGINNWFQDKVDALGPVGEYATLGTEENSKVLLGSAAVPGTFLALGIASVVAGMFVVFPLIGGPATTNAEAEFLSQVRSAGDSIFGFAEKALDASWKLAIVPAGVCALSVPKKVFNILAEKVDQKTLPGIKDKREILNLIDDLLAEKEDPTLEFPAKFLKRVDLRENSEKFNMELFGFLAYYRYCLKQVREGQMDEEMIDKSFEDIVAFLEDSQHRLGVSKSFKNNRFVKMLIDQYGYKEEDFHHMEESESHIAR